MKDYTAAVIRLSDAYSSMQIARRRAADEVKASFKAVIDRAIKEKQADIERDFAEMLAGEHAAGLPGNIIRAEVLRTQDWSRWKKWRDMAGIEAERITAANAKRALEAANSPFQWAADYSTLTVVKNSVGADIEPVVYDMSTNRFIANGAIWWPDSGSAEENGISEAEREAKKNDNKFGRFVSDEIQRKIDNKEIEEP